MNQELILHAIAITIALAIIYYQGAFLLGIIIGIMHRIIKTIQGD
jgi:ABC-type amino acid transport system permease subunit